MTDCGYWGDYSLDDPNCFECKGTRKFSCLLRTIHELEQEELYWANKWYECIVQLEGRKDHKPELSPELRAIVKEGLKKNRELLRRLAD